MPLISGKTIRFVAAGCAIGLAALAVAVIVICTPAADNLEPSGYLPRRPIETSGYRAVFDHIPALADRCFVGGIRRRVPASHPERPGGAWTGNWRTGLIRWSRCSWKKRACCTPRETRPGRTRCSTDLEARIKGTDLEAEWLYTVIYYKGVTALRMGENDNCVLCRGESVVHLPHCSGSRPHQPRWLPPGNRTLQRVSPAVPRRPRSEMAAQPGAHDAGRASRQGRSAPSAAAGCLRQVGVRYRASSATSAISSG